MREEDIDDLSFINILQLFKEDKKNFARFCDNMKYHLEIIHQVPLDKADFGTIKHRTTIITNQSPKKNKLLVFINLENKGRLIFQNLPAIPLAPQKIYTFTSYSSPSFLIDPEQNDVLSYIFFKSPNF